MKIALTLFPPSHAEARARLAAFAPKSGAAYARLRNFDYGPGQHGDVSTLSPYVKMRALDEPEIVHTVLETQTKAAAEKFIAEVFWRTYWKGWMELRPDVWQGYINDLNRLQDEVATQSGLRARWEDACLGQTGIAPFDVWAQELAQTGYLHNHARMWFASIWIFTLGLPWQLGADFFLRHLLDGDAAVNTLSWRWVAGIQTQGKTYLARADNIAKFTQGRFGPVPGLAQTPLPVETDRPNPPPRTLPQVTPLPLPKRYGLLLHEDDADAARLLAHAPDPVAVAYLDQSAGHSPWHMAPHVNDFRSKLAQDMTGGNNTYAMLETQADVQKWATTHALEQIIAPYAPVGPTAQLFDALAAQDGLPPLSLHRRALDTAAWPLATKGFFPFRKEIPKLVSRFVRG